MPEKTSRQFWDGRTVEQRKKVLRFDKSMRHPTYKALVERWATKSWAEIEADPMAKEATENCIFLWQAYGKL